MKKEFSKYNSFALKGIAIVMMLIHHCFRTFQVFQNYDVSFSPFTADTIVKLADTFKICVSIFAFITGYGLFLSYNKLKENSKNKDSRKTSKETFKWITNRLVKMLSGFWIIAILSYIICQIINGMTIKVFFQHGLLYGCLSILINFLGLSTLFKTPDFNATWWYLSLAVVFIIVVPIIANINKKYGIYVSLLITIFLPRILGIQNNYIYFLLAMILGMVFAEKNLMVKIANIKILKHNILNKILKFIIETIIVILAYRLNQELSLYLFWEIKYAIIPIIFMCYSYEFIIDLPIIKNILYFLGKHSLNMFLIHDFIRTTYLTDWLYSFKNFGTITLVLLLFSLALSIAVELLKKLIRYNKLIEKVEIYLDKKLDNVSI